jgi:ribosomal protein L14E/L6E/L27E
MEPEILSEGAEEIAVGCIVQARVGRDQGSYYIVCQVYDKCFVGCVDGLKRRMANPKKKNRKHLVLRQPVDYALANDISIGKNNIDADIRAGLRRVMPKERREEGLLNAKGRLD